MATLQNTWPSYVSVRPSALVVEDDLVIGNYLVDILADMGFEATAVASCAEALTIARDHSPFAVAFIDLALPDGSGLELMSELKRLQADLPIVIASGYGSMALRDTDERNHPPPVLSKPYNNEIVANILAELGIAAA